MLRKKIYPIESVKRILVEQSATQREGGARANGVVNIFRRNFETDRLFNLGFAVEVDVAGTSGEIQF